MALNDISVVTNEFIMLLSLNKIFVSVIVIMILMATNILHINTSEEEIRWVFDDI